MKNNKQKNVNSIFLQIFSFFGVLALLTFIGLLFFLRPAKSETEKRELTKFPSFTFESFASGEYFAQIGKWYSDTYPGRDFLTSLSTDLESSFGSGNEEIHGQVVEGDEIPDEYTTKAIVKDNETTTEPVTSAKEIWEKIDASGDTQSLGAVFVAGNQGFEYYNFDQTVANDYVYTLNTVAERLGDIPVYDIIIPTSIAITLPDEYLKTINSSDQEKAIKYMYSGMGDKVHKINIYNTMMSHRKEYIYFNTDHHWTALGAYYAYADYTKAAGITTQPLSKYKKVEYPGFLGSFYTDTGKLKALESNPDTIIAYEPNENATLVYTDSKGQKIAWKIVNDVSNYGQTIKYSCFIAGDNSFTEITNPDITDGSSIVVVKESFGNALVPFLVENYSKVYVIDYRYYKGSVSQFAQNNNVDAVLYLNNISATRNKYLVGKLKADI
ncbi:MAG: hypothetical protein K5761_02135 [Clostridiales bacterium]|nr:hypothetical protein [Clostridiales bacterium]